MKTIGRILATLYYMLMTAAVLFLTIEVERYGIEPYPRFWISVFIFSLFFFYFYGFTKKDD